MMCVLACQVQDYFFPFTTALGLNKPLKNGYQFTGFSGKEWRLMLWPGICEGQTCRQEVQLGEKLFQPLLKWSLNPVNPPISNQPIKWLITIN